MGGGSKGEGGYETAPPRQIFEKLVNKNAIKSFKTQNRWTPLAIFPETLDPPPPLGILAKNNFKYPPPPPGFSTRVHLCAKMSWVHLTK